MKLGVEQVAHVRLEGLDVELLAGMLLDRCTDAGIKLKLALDCRGLAIGVARVRHVLRDIRIGPGQQRNRLVKRDAQGLGRIQRTGLAGIAGWRQLPWPPTKEIAATGRTGSALTQRRGDAFERISFDPTSADTSSCKAQTALRQAGHGKLICR